MRYSLGSRHVITAAVLGAALLAGAACSEDPATRQRRFLERGTRFLGEGKYNEAIIELRGVLQIDKRHGRALQGLGRAYFAKAWYGDAARELRNAIEVDPASVPTRILLARAYLALEMWRDAREQGEIVAKQSPGDPQADFIVGAALAGMGDGKAGIPRLRAAAAKLPKAPEIHEALGDALAQQAEVVEAERAYRAALALAPDSVDAILGVAALLLRDRRPADAEPFLVRARTLQPDAANVRLALHTLYAVQGKEAEAIAALEDLTESAWSPRFELVLGESYVRLGRYDRAAEVLGRLVRQFPSITPARYWLGYASLGENRPDRALEAFERVVKEMPDNPAPRYGLAIAYRHVGRAREALAQLDRLGAALGTRSADYHLERARCLRDLQRLEEAYQAAEAARKLAPGSGEPYAVLGQIAVARNDLARAQELYGRALELQPKDAGLHVAFGHLMGLQHRPGDALRAFDAALVAEPQNERAVQAKVATLSEQGGTDAALAFVADLARRDDKNPRWPTLAGGLLARRGDMRRAEAEYRRALKVDEDFAPAQFNLARLLARTKREQDAIGYLQRLVERAPGDEAAAGMLASLFARQARYDRAIAVLEGAVRANPRQHDLSLQLAGLALARGQAGDAVGRLAALVEAQPDLLAARTLLGVAYLERGDAQMAIAQVERVNAVNPRIARNHYLLARARLAQGDRAAARQAYETALRLDPQLGEARLGLALLTTPRGDTTALLARQKELQAAVAADPGNVSLRFSLATAHLAARQVKEAEGELMRILEAAPSYGPAYQQLALVRQIQGRGDDAAELLQNLARLNPEHVGARLLLADYFEGRQNFESAAVQLEEALRIAPERQEVRVRLAMLYGEVGRLDDGLDLARIVVRARPKAAAGHFLSGSLLLKKGDLAGARAAVETAIALEPKLGPAHVVLGTALERMGEIDRATEAYRRATVLMPTEPHPANNLAWVLSIRRRGLDEALQQAQRAVSLAERVPQRERAGLRAAFLDTLGYVRYQRGEFAEAARVLREAAELAGDNPLFNFHLGMAYHRLGRNGDASSSLQRALMRPASLTTDDVQEARRVLRELGG